MDFDSARGVDMMMLSQANPDAAPTLIDIDGDDDDGGQDSKRPRLSPQSETPPRPSAGGPVFDVGDSPQPESVDPFAGQQLVAASQLLGELAN
eukprot:8656451-Pyramimonas_sp.AAC.1